MRSAMGYHQGMFLNFSKIFASVAILFLLSACVSQREYVAVCTGKDWYELGRRDGIQGAPTDRMTVYKRECGEGFSIEHQSLYTNGRNAGLVEYCEKSNAFDLGRMGVVYHNVCPSLTEEEFLKEYRRGQQARQIEAEKRRLDSHIQSLNEKLDQAGFYERDRLEDEIDQLKKLRAQAFEEASRLSN